MSAKRLPRQVVPLASPIRDQDDLDAALAHLLTLDSGLFGPLMAAAGPPPLRLRAADFGGLVWIIVSQQVSTASAQAIHARVMARFPDFDPQAFATASDLDMKSCGLSWPKIRTLRAAAEAVRAGVLDFTALVAMPADAAHAVLVSIKGIGPWTADIFLLSCLGHADAWPAGDLALREAARMALRLEQRPDAREMTRIGEAWRPVRAVAARILWAWYRHVKQSGRSLPKAEA
jgi:DNA-3-methyladenine glycosylase II